MRCKWMVMIALLGTACTSTMDGTDTTDDAYVVLRVEPAAATLAVELGAPAPTVAFRVLAARADGTEDDVTTTASLLLDGAPVAIVTAGQVASDGHTGGEATLHVSFDNLATTLPIVANVHSHRLDPNAPPGIDGAFDTATRTPFDHLVDPADGAVLPPNLGALEVSFLPAATADVYQVRFTAPHLAVDIVARAPLGDIRPQHLTLSADEWQAIVRTGIATPVELDVASLDSTAPATVYATSNQIAIADLAADDLVVGGLTTDITAPTPFRYDMHAANAHPLWTNGPTNACIGCHWSISADGKRFAAGMVNLDDRLTRGAVFDIATGGTILTADQTPAQWLTAGFDPTGQLLTAFQGQLMLRAAGDYTPLAAITIDDSAAAPTIAPDNGSVAYVSLDNGLDTPGASQPAGNALRIRPWNPVSGLMGDMIELARTPLKGVILPSFSPDGQWVAYGQTDAPLNDRISQIALATIAVRADGSGTAVTLTSDPTDQLARWDSPVATAHASGDTAEPMVWIAIVSGRSVAGQAPTTHQLWLAAFYPERGVVMPAFRLPGQTVDFNVLHGPARLPG